MTFVLFAASVLAPFLRACLSSRYWQGSLWVTLALVVCWPAQVGAQKVTAAELAHEKNAALGGDQLCARQHQLATPRLNTPTWYRPLESDTVVIFVHGIFSSNRAAWLAENCEFFPNLVATDRVFDSASILLGGFYTATDSGNYDLFDVTAVLLEKLRSSIDDHLRPPMARNNIIFVTHSTGGIVVRKMIFQNQNEFLGKRIGLVLIASPTRGSPWADILSPVINLSGNKLADILRTDSTTLLDLDQDFGTYLGSRINKEIFGLEILEHKFIVDNCVLGMFCSKDWRIVAKESGGAYFKPAFTVPNSTHFTVAKPDSVKHDTLTYLRNFYTKHFSTLAQKYDFSVNKSSRLGITYTVSRPDWRAVPVDDVSYTLPDERSCVPSTARGVEYVDCVITASLPASALLERQVITAVNFDVLGSSRPKEIVSLVSSAEDDRALVSLTLKREGDSKWNWALRRKVQGIYGQIRTVATLPSQEIEFGESVKFSIPEFAIDAWIEGNILGRKVRIAEGADDGVGKLRYEGRTNVNGFRIVTYSLNR